MLGQAEVSQASYIRLPDYGKRPGGGGELGGRAPTPQDRRTIDRRQSPPWMGEPVPCCLAAQAIVIRFRRIAWAASVGVRSEIGYAQERGSRAGLHDTPSGRLTERASAIRRARSRRIMAGLTSPRDDKGRSARNGRRPG